MGLDKNIMAAAFTAIYIRVSTEKQVEKGYSIPEQDCKLKALCVAQDLGKYEVYLDDGYTGKDMNRPDLQRLIRDIKAGKIKNIVIYKLDRLSRSLRDTLELIEDVLIPNECRLISLTENLDTSTPVGRLIISILSAFAQLERETIKERMQMGMVGRVKTGKWKGTGTTPFGYDYDKEKGILIKNSDADKVKQLYDMYLQGCGLEKIAEQLGIYSGTTAGRILDNSLNYGNMNFKGKRYKGLHEPIITEDIYNQAMVMRKQRRGTIQKTRGENLLGNGLIVCGKCGAKMGYERRKNSPTIIQCYSRRHLKKNLVKDPNCNNLSLLMSEVENSVINELLKVAGAPAETSVSSHSDDSAILKLLQSNYAEIEKRIKRLYSLYSINEDEILLETIDEHKQELSDLQAQINTETKLKETTNKPVYKPTKILNANWQDLEFAQKREIVRHYINKIVVTDRIVEIYWLSGDQLKTVINIEHEKSNIFEKFMLDCMLENISAKYKASEVYRAYIMWSKEKGIQPGTKRHCFAELRKKGILVPWATDNQGKTGFNLVVGYDFKTNQAGS